MNVQNANAETRDVVDDLQNKTITHFRILSPLGRGGMGEVYKAYDEKLKRHVAIKALRHDQRLTQESKARFIREAEILSSLEHPNICRIYEFIEEKERDFLVLEFIEGQNLLQAKQAGLSYAEKSRIAAQVASGLTVAHEKQVVHRDLKPENVMITPKGDVKILDFGLAHSLRTGGTQSDVTSTTQSHTQTKNSDRPSPSNQDSSMLPSDSFQTEYGLVMGTPHFLSPEQASGETTTAASDMYTFGLLLHWLFSTSPLYPKKLDTEGVHIKAIIGETLPTEGVPADLSRFIQRLKSLAPELRPTAVEALTQLEWIQNKPKRRLKRLILLTMMCSLGIGIVFSTMSYFRLKHANTQTQAVNAFLKKMLTSPQPTHEGIDVKVVDLLDFASLSADADFAQLPETKGAVLHTLGQVYTALGGFDKASRHLKQALDVRRSTLGETHVDTLDTMTELTVALTYEASFSEAEIVTRKSLALIQDELGEDHPFYLIQMNNLAAIYMGQAKTDEAEAMFRKTWQLEKRLLGPDHSDTLSCMNNLAAFLNQTQKLPEAEIMFREVVDLLRNKLGSEHPKTLKSQGNLAKNLLDQEKLDEALSAYGEVLQMQDKILGPDHRDTMQTQCIISGILHAKGRHEEAERVKRDALKKRTRVMGVNHPDTIRILFNLAKALQKQGKHAEAEPLWKDIITRETDLFGENHKATLRSLCHQVQTLLALGKNDAAESILDTFFSKPQEVLDENASETQVAMKLRDDLHKAH